MSKETKWTPGPWEWSEDRFNGGYSALMSGYDYVIYPQRCNDGDDGAAWFGTDEDYYGDTALTEANAHLIAAAPELYDALEALAALYDTDEGCRSGEEYQAARAALAKARGEQ